MVTLFEMHISDSCQWLCLYSKMIASTKRNIFKFIKVKTSSEKLQLNCLEVLVTIFVSFSFYKASIETFDVQFSFCRNIWRQKEFFMIAALKTRQYMFPWFINMIIVFISTSIKSNTKLHELNYLKEFHQWYQVL